MEKTDVASKMKALALKLNEASYAYYQKDAQIMTDKEYDQLYDELLALENETGVVLSNSPTQKVGYEVVSALAKVRHETPMLSLDKTKETEKLVQFLQEPTEKQYQLGLLSWKIDGLTIVLKYQNGKLLQAVTRGNGEVGEDVTHNVRVFQNIPLSIPFEGTLYLRGEAVIPFSEFEKINAALEEGELKYKNPRNLTSGTVRQLNSEEAGKRNAMFYAFSLVATEGADFGDSKEKMLGWLKNLGFDVVEYKMVTPENVEAAVQWFKEKTAVNDFASDGLVLTYDSLSYSESLGVTSKFPKDSIAFKWADETAETTVREIEWNTSRTGLINPVAIFDEVELEGTVVSRASLHNAGIVEEMAIGVGDRVCVYKANMIIPQIYENLTKKGVVSIPGHCPVCGARAELRKTKEQKALYCTNPNCHAVLVRFLTHFVSRDAMNIEGLSEATIEKLVERKYLENYVDIFELSRYYEEIKTLEGFGEKSVQKLDESINKAKNTELPRFINALGISQVGLAGAKMLCRHFSYDLDKIMSAGEEALAEIEGFGGVTAKAVWEYFNLEENKALINKALQYIRYEVPEEGDTKDHTLNGLVFVITGDLVHFKNRNQLKSEIESKGGKVTGSVTGKTTYLINNDSASASSKNKKARELGVPILTEEEIMKMLQG